MYVHVISPLWHMYLYCVMPSIVPLHIYIHVHIICLYVHTCRYDTKEEVINFIDEVVQQDVLEAGLEEGGKVTPGSLMEAVRRTGRNVAHAMLLCANRRGINFFTKKKPNLIKV